jgi:hypothetical protein
MRTHARYKYLRLFKLHKPRKTAMTTSPHHKLRPRLTQGLTDSRILVLPTQNGESFAGIGGSILIHTRKIKDSTIVVLSAFVRDLKLV